MEFDRLESFPEKAQEIINKVGHLACNGLIAYGAIRAGTGLVEMSLNGGGEAIHTTLVGTEIMGFGLFYHKVIDLEDWMIKKWRDWRRPFGLDDRGDL